MSAPEEDPFEDREEASYGSTSMPPHIPLPLAQEVLSADRRLSRSLFWLAALFALLAAVVYFIDFDPTQKVLVLSTEFGTYKGCISGGFLILAGWSVYCASSRNVIRSK